MADTLEDTTKKNSLHDSEIDILGDFDEIGDNEGLTSQIQLDSISLGQMNFYQKKQHLDSIRAEQPSKNYLIQQTQTYTQTG